MTCATKAAGTNQFISQSGSLHTVAYTGLDWVEKHVERLSLYGYMHMIQHMCQEILAGDFDTL